MSQALLVVWFYLVSIWRGLENQVRHLLKEVCPLFSLSDWLPRIYLFKAASVLLH